ncbi:MAG: InlB B-repeat-containing protein [Lachnospiraceae bacterium]|nr:InlB B-repeat-containing protein [Lachnospiraceae bacterium]
MKTVLKSVGLAMLLFMAAAGAVFLSAGAAKGENSRETLPEEKNIEQEASRSTEAYKASSAPASFVFGFTVKGDEEAEKAPENVLRVWSRQLEVGDAVVSLSGKMPETTEAEVVRESGMEGEAFDPLAVSDQPALVGGAAEGGDFFRILHALDITLSDQNGEVQPENGPVYVYVRSEAVAAADPETVEVYHMEEDGSRTRVEEVSVGNGTVRFPAEHFSVYIIVEHEGGTEIVTPRVEFHFIGPNYADVEDGIQYEAAPYVFANSAEEKQVSQILKDGEDLERIVNPPNTEKKTFMGWFIVDMESDTTGYDAASKSYGGLIAYKWGADPGQVEFEKAISIETEKKADGSIASLTWRIGETERTAAGIDTEGCAHVYLAPVYDDYYFVDFYIGYKELDKDATNLLAKSLLARKLVVLGSDGEAAVRIGSMEAPSPDAAHKIFLGWESVQRNEDGSFVKDSNGYLVRDQYYETRDDVGNEINAERESEAYNLTLNKSQFDSDRRFLLYPVFVEARWIHFHAEDGSYVPSVYRKTNDDGHGNFFKTLPISSRNGYVFDGWYDGAPDSNGNVTGNQVTDRDGKVVSSLDVKDAENKQLYLCDENGLSVYRAMDKMELYAKWTKNEKTSYKVIIWKQKVTDDKDAAKEDKTYDYETVFSSDEVLSSESVDPASFSGSYVYLDGETTRSGKVLEKSLKDQSFMNALTGLAGHFTGFQFARTDMSGVPEPDGTTVYNVYYDRELRKIIFNYKFSAPVTWTGLYGQRFSMYNYEWEDVSSYLWHDGESYQTFLDAFIQDENPYNLSQDSKNGKNEIFHYRQGLDGHYNQSEGNRVYSSGGRFNFSNKYTGFTVSKYSRSFNPAGGDQPATESYNGQYPLHIYHTRNSYDLTFNVNYPTGLADREFAEGRSVNKTVKLLFEEPLSAYGESGKNYFIPNTPNHYIFMGWFEDTEGEKEFNFNSTMPAANKIIYGHWVPEYFLVQMDPDGGEIDHINHNIDRYTIVNQTVDTFRKKSAGYSGYNTVSASYFYVDYGESVGQYTIERNYVEIGDGEAESFAQWLLDNPNASETDKEAHTVYYYLNTQYRDSDGDGIPADLRNALYLTQDEIAVYYNFYKSYLSAKKAEDPEKYKDTDILSRGAFQNAYISGQKYRKLSDGEHYSLKGWYQVNADGTLESTPYNFKTPLEGPLTLKAVWRLDGAYTIRYLPSYYMEDGTEINGEMEVWLDPNPSSGQVRYSDQAETKVYRQPTGITADGQPAAEDYIFRGWRVVAKKEARDAQSTETYYLYTPLEDGVFYDPGDEFVVQAKYVDAEGYLYMQAVYEKSDEAYRRPKVANLILDANGGYLGDASEEPLTENRNLSWDDVGTIALDAEADTITFGDIQSNQAVNLYKYATDAVHNSVSGVNYFYKKDANGNPLRLIGFDAKKNEGDYLADYPADSVISLQRTDQITLYAVWEPMVYLSFKNETSGALTLGLEAGEIDTLEVVNEEKGEYSRELIEDINDVGLPAGGTLKLVIPNGIDKTVTALGENTLGPGKILKWESKLGETVKGSASCNNKKSFSIANTLLLDKNGIIVTFTEEQQQQYRTLILHDNYEGGAEEEINFSSDSTYTLPARSRGGYSFKGWAATANATEAAYSSGTEYNFEPLFGSDQVRYLYAVWETPTAASGTVEIWNTVPAPGVQTKEFTFTYTITAMGTLYYNNKYYSVSDEAKVELAHGEHMTIKTSRTSGYYYDYYTITITSYNADGSQKGSGTITLKYNSFNITFTSLTVTQTTDADYAFSVSRSVESSPNALSLNDSVPSVSWTDASAGGTAVFCNTIRTWDVTVKKDLLPSGARDRFSFSGSYVFNGEKSVLGTFSLTDDGTKTFEKIPQGAVLTITEAANSLFVTTSSAANGTADTNSADNIFTATIDKNETITFKNTRLACPVKIVKKGSDDGKVEARFDLASETLTVLSGKYTTDTQDVIYDADLYADTYYLTETWTQDGYAGLKEPLKITVPGNDVEAITVEGEGAEKHIEKINSVRTCVITLTNQKVDTLGIHAILSDPLLVERTFEYKLSYTLEGKSFAESFDVEAGDTVYKHIPVAASDISLEQTGAYLASEGEYNVTAKYSYKNADRDQTLTQGKNCCYTASLGTLTPDSGDEAPVFMLSFTNTRKMVTIPVSKVLEGAEGEPVFRFTAFLGYRKRENIKYAAGGFIETNNSKSFTVTAGSSSDLTIPVNVILTVAEQLEGGDSAEYKPRYLVENQDADLQEAAQANRVTFTVPVKGDTAIRFTNQKKKPVHVVLKKVGGESKTPLSGGKFTLYYSDRLIKVSDFPENSAALGSGILFIGELSPGTYYLVESEAPEGYTAASFKLLVNEDGSTSVAKDS